MPSYLETLAGVYSKLVIQTVRVGDLVECKLSGKTFTVREDSFILNVDHEVLYLTRSQITRLSVSTADSVELNQYDC